MIEVCRASAGSGKTYKLTGDYILKLFQNGDKDGYKHILAVTFTNKATDEMKQRILEKLYSLSTTTEKDEIYDNIFALENLQWMGPQSRDKYIRESAGKILIEILNDYSQFNISTIDKFFQQTMRSFARELGHFSSYNVELDSDSVLSETLDLMMDSLSENKGLLDWMIRMSIESIERGEGWNPLPKLMELGGQLFKEALKLKQRELGVTIADKKEIEEYRAKMESIITSFEEENMKIGDQGCRLIGESGLSCDMFSGGSRSPFYLFEKWSKGDIKSPTATFQKLENNVEKWYTKGAGAGVKNRIETLYSCGLNDLVSQAVTLYSEDYILYNSARMISRNLFTLGILGDIYEVLQKYCKEKNIVLLSETNDVLNKIIDGSDTPFIYEKMGVWLEHYLIDEFQDTSKLQWANILPLVMESADKGHDNLIVGDVKQSIYRWRNSDWSLLNQKIFKDLSKYNIKDESLDKNWRSLKEIVIFNNDFFLSAGEKLEERYREHVGIETNSMIARIYSNFEQKVALKSEDSGHVKISFVSDEEDKKWRDVSLEHLIGDIKILIGNGWSFGDMAVLVRTNKEGTMVAERLLDAGYKIVSDESLIISSSQSVQKIVTALKFISTPDDPLMKFVFDGVEISSSEKTLYNICEDIARQLPPQDRLEGAFIQAFMDCVLDYTLTNGSDIEGFVKWWDETGRKRSISAPEGDDAIRIITIHKSKGLGFHVVFVPFFKEELYDARVEDDGKILWCTPKVPPFDEMKILPVASSSAMLDTIFASEYQEEILYSYIDKINVAYVAFTRAKSELLVYGKLPDFKQDGSYTKSSMSDILYSYCGNRNEYEKGEWVVKNSQTIGGCSAVDGADSVFVSEPIGERLKLSLSSGDFFSMESKRGRGVVLHDILSKVATASDLERAVDEALSEGLIAVEERDEVLSDLTQRISSVADRHWYDGTYDFKNEIEIILPGGEFRRPDRIMVSGEKAIVVDYKFGQIKKSSYIKQVQNYMTYLSQMGYTDTKGYIWYLEDNDVAEV